MAAREPLFAGEVRSTVGNGSSLVVALQRLPATWPTAAVPQSGSIERGRRPPTPLIDNHPGAELEAADDRDTVGSRLVINASSHAGCTTDGRACFHDRFELWLPPTIARPVSPSCMPIRLNTASSSPPDRAGCGASPAASSPQPSAVGFFPRGFAASSRIQKSRPPSVLRSASAQP